MTLNLRILLVALGIFSLTAVFFRYQVVRLNEVAYVKTDRFTGESTYCFIHNLLPGC